MNSEEMILGIACMVAATLMLTVPRLRRSPRILRFWPARVVTLAGIGALLLDSGIRGRDNLELLTGDLLLGAVILLAAERGGRSDGRVDAPASGTK